MDNKTKLYINNKLSSEWRKLAQYLKFTSNEIAVFEHYNRHEGERCYQVLVKLYQREPTDINVILLKTLRKWLNDIKNSNDNITLVYKDLINNLENCINYLEKLFF